MVATAENEPSLVFLSIRKPVSLFELSLQFTVILQYGASPLSQDMFVRYAFDGDVGGSVGGGGGGGGLPQSAEQEYEDSPCSQSPLPQLGEGYVVPSIPGDGGGVQSLLQEE